MPGPDLGVGVVGAGFMGGVHATVFRDHTDARVVAVAEPDEARRRAYAAAHGVPRAYATAHDLCRDPEVDLVVVATPNAAHEPACLDALRAGKHVFVEKPLALSLEGAERMVAAAEAAGRRLLYAAPLRHAPKVLRAAGLVRQRAALGAVHHLGLVFRTPGPSTSWYRDPRLSGGGAALDLGCHLFQLAAWLKGGTAVKSVYAHLKTLDGDGPVDDHAVIVLEYDDGGTALCEVSWAHPTSEEVLLEVGGRDGLVRVDLWKDGLAAFTRHRFTDVWAPASGWVHPEREWLHENGYAGQAAATIEALRSGAPTVTGLDGLAVLEVVLAAYRSAGAGRKLALPYRPREVVRPIDLWRPMAETVVR